MQMLREERATRDVTFWPLCTHFPVTDKAFSEMIEIKIKSTSDRHRKKARVYTTHKNWI
jgi:hypothetical protein